MQFSISIQQPSTGYCYKAVSYFLQVSLESPICGRLQQLLGLRLKMESVLPRLQGKLDLVIGQVAQRQLDEVGQDALQIYEEGGKFFSRSKSIRRKASFQSVSTFEVRFDNNAIMI